MNRNSLMLVVSTSLLASSTLASTMTPIIPESSKTWVITLSGGPVWENGGRTQTFSLTPEIEKTYVANRTTQILFDGEVFAGLQKRLSRSTQGQLGLAVAATSDANLSGVIWDDANPQFDNYTYQYKIQHTHVTIKGKLLVDIGCWFTPWISGSAGIGFNRASSFNNTPTIPEAIKNTNFTSYTETAFVYTVGIGVQKTLNSHWEVGLGYELADWGKSNLGRAEGQTLHSGLALSHLYTNGVLLNLSYLT